MYLPQNKTQYKETSGREFVRISDIKKEKKIYYIGPYMELANGTFYIGKNARYRGEQLLKPISEQNFFGESTDSLLYKRLQTTTYAFLNKTTAPKCSCQPKCTWKKGKGCS